jgi:hypothetical protein
MTEPLKKSACSMLPQALAGTIGRLRLYRTAGAGKTIPGKNPAPEISQEETQLSGRDCP